MDAEEFDLADGVMAKRKAPKRCFGADRTFTLGLR
ncbi:hypothetical protein Cylst_4053 [Cylindrospermum stagnale PCC 7417]|uniref:Uncharacterized protein n=1 Tax=Cylindrospermum stagnale PCC 7417 TaxID=56107 RepID=K9X115_9NOST|nr:hypothetical protein Cylst_4053 [Cylindrospermum stagnale PCC 7417]